MTAQPAAPEVVVYRTRYCAYCTLATRLLSALGVVFREVDVSGDPEARRWLARHSGQRTVPQIFVGERSIGGYRELRQLLDGGAGALFDTPSAGAASEAKAGAGPEPKHK